MAEVRVRFAPSPTGYLHIGGIRTALYSWLWARQNQGTFILRIEDTDRKRSTQQSINIVLESMRWLGLDWDEGPELGGAYGPYTQTARSEIYTQYVHKLLQNGHAYRCYASKEEIESARKAYEKTGKKGFRFQSPWRNRTEPPDNPNAPHVIRFRSPQTGTTTWIDKIKGRVEIPNETQQDFILLRSEGLPLYNFGCVIDDLTMKVSLVARGDDHLINTAPQILLYKALGANPPEFAHMPMVLAPNGEKLSKRHAAVSVLEYRDMGYLPDSILNYLARLGWSYGDQEIFTRQELIEKFSWDRVGSAASQYDAKKFLAVQAEHLRMLSDTALAQQVVAFLNVKGACVKPDHPTLLAAIPHVKLRARTLVELADGLFYFVGEVVFDEKAKKKFLLPPHADHLEQLATLVESIEPFEQQQLHDTIIQWLAEHDLKLKQVAQPARVALTGRTQSPGLFEVMEVLGKKTTVNRLRTGATFARNGQT